jgi:hypothetical protein
MMFSLSLNHLSYYKLMLCQTTKVYCTSELVLFCSDLETEGQILKPEDQHHCLFLDAKGDPQPLDMSQLLLIPSPTFCFKAEPSGGVTLDKLASSAFQM